MVTNIFIQFDWLLVINKGIQYIDEREENKSLMLITLQFNSINIILDSYKLK